MQAVLRKFGITDSFLWKYCYFIWVLKRDTERATAEKTQAEKIAVMNSMNMDELVAHGFMSEKDSRMLKELQQAVISASVNDEFCNYGMGKDDPLFIHAKFAGGKPQCWMGYHDFNLRHSNDRSALMEELYRTVARKMVFHATVKEQPEVYKSTQTNFAAEEFDPELTFLKIFDRYEGSLSNG